jgi:hypothetical protein
VGAEAVKLEKNADQNEGPSEMEGKICVDRTSALLCKNADYDEVVTLNQYACNRAPGSKAPQ